MSVYLSPGVYAREIDLSLYIPNLSTTALGLVGLATKGPINVPTYVSDPVQYALNFGDPYPEFFGQYAALQFLHTGRQLWFVRVSASETNQDLINAGDLWAAKYSSLNLYESATKARVANTSNAPVSLTATTNKLTFIIDNIAPGFTVTFPVSGSSTKYSIPGIIATLNANSHFNKYLFASTNINGYLLIERVLPGTARSFKLDVSNSSAKAVLKFPTTFQNGDPVTGTGTAIDRAFVASQQAGPFDTAGGTKALLLNFGTDNVTDGINHTESIEFTPGLPPNAAVTYAGVIPGNSSITVDGVVHNSSVLSQNGNADEITWPTITMDKVHGADDIGDVAFVGTGVDDIAFSPYVGLSQYEVKIVNDAGPDQFAWAVDGGLFSAAIDITAGVAQELGTTGVMVTFVADTGHVIDDVWTLSPVIAFGGTWTGTIVAEYYVSISSLAPDSFTWKKNVNGISSVEIPIVAGVATLIEDGITVTFGSASGHIAVDTWKYTTPNTVSIDLSSGDITAPNLPAGFYDVSYSTGEMEIPFTGPAAVSNLSMASLVAYLNGYFEQYNVPLIASIMYEGVTLPANAERLVVSFDASADPTLPLSGKYLQFVAPTAPAVDATADIFGSAPIFNGTASTDLTTIVSSPQSAVSLVVKATSQGTWGNKLAVSVESVDPTKGTFGLSVYEKGFVVERYKNLVKFPLTIPDPLVPGATVPNPSYVENAINGVSARITVTNPTISEGVYSTLLPDSTFLEPNLFLTGGSDGAPPADSPDPSIYIGIANGFQKTGLQFFRNPEEIDLNLIAVPGIYDAAVINEQIDICTTRADCMAIIDPPFNYTPQQVVTWRNGANTILAGGVMVQSDHQAFNSSYAALYWPWLQIYDPVNAQTVWTPPSGHVANVYAYTDYTTESWFAPAGLTRGRLATPIKAEYNPTLGERDLLYQNSINPIATFIRDGINVWGQKTLQTKPTALDRVNVRRLMLYLEKVISTAARVLLFEPDDPITWKWFINIVEPYLDGIVARRGIVEYKVRCDETTNTPDVRDRNEMVGIIFIKPTKAVEFLQIDFVLTAQGANFDELVY